ncbi:DMT family transporter [Roseomonas marmotae]|uniref:DMT family transporter n=1 Tax=Roseomonas marmotae TaxID=2768161 RepID=A0ABS3KCA5_9PROT|nr:DMT family transporter [Roseomonas marmotae]MBO1073971.1 DMT family transporter [Roseomonas marmotae]QTI78763.1 DMT family transporter [Roseomonas marmotae]
MQPAILSKPEPAEAAPEDEDRRAAARRVQAARRAAILCVLGAAATFALASAAVKALQGTVPVMQVIFFRNLLAIPVLLVLALASARQAGGLAALLSTSRPFSHVQRITYGLIGMFGSFYGYVHLPLATVTALGFTMPFFLAALSVPMLGEKVKAWRLLAMAVGFGGVLVMLRPWSGIGASGLPLVPVLVVLAGAVGWALSMITIRRMGDGGESGTTIVLWFAFGGAAVGGLAAVPGWVWPEPWQWALLLAVGVVSAFAQLLMTAAYRRGETTLIAPFEYSGILWTTALGVMFWNEWPDGWSFLGILVLVAAGLGMWWRDTRQSA